MVPIVVVITVAVYTAIGNTHFKRAFQAERNDRVPRNSYRASTHLTAADRSKNLPYKGVVTLRFHAVGVASNCITLPVDHHGFQIQNEVVVLGHANDQFRARAAWNCQMAVVAPNVLINRTVVNTVVASLHIDTVIGAHRDNGPGFKPRVHSPIAIPVPVTILAPAHR